MNKVLIKNTVIPQAPPYYLTLSTGAKITDISTLWDVILIGDIVDLKRSIIHNHDYYFTLCCRHEIIHTCLNEMYYLI
jgi:hypothetical protein